MDGARRRTDRQRHMGEADKQTGVGIETEVHILLRIFAKASLENNLKGDKLAVHGV